MLSIKIDGTTPESREEQIRTTIKEATKLLTGMPSDITFVKISHWADVCINDKQVACYRFSTEVLDKDREFIRRLLTHEMAHIVDHWLSDGFRTDNKGRSLIHDKFWKKLCRLLGDPNPSTRM